MLRFLPAIDRYIFRLVIVPMLSVFAIAASLLVLDKMLRLFDFVAIEGGPVGVVFKMLIALVPEYASLAIPLGLLLGILLAFARVVIVVGSADREGRQNLGHCGAQYRIASPNRKPRAARAADCAAGTARGEGVEG